MSFMLLLTDCTSEAETVVTALTGIWNRAIERTLGFTTYCLWYLWLCTWAVTDGFWDSVWAVCALCEYVLRYLVLEGATAHKVSSSSSSRLLFLSWAAWQAELEMSHWLLGTSCSLMDVMYCSVFNSKKPQKFLKIACKQSKFEIKTS